MRRKVLEGLLRFVAAAPVPLLTVLLRNFAVSAHLATMLAASDARIAAAALQVKHGVCVRTRVSFSFCSGDVQIVEIIWHSSSGLISVQMVQLLVEKLPDVFNVFFRRKGML